MAIIATPARRPAVFIATEMRNPDQGNPSEFGDIRIIFPVNFRRVSIYNVQDYMNAAEQRFKELCFDAEFDHVCICPPQTQAFLVFTAIARRHKSINVLIFDIGNQRYVSKEISTWPNNA